MNQGDLGCTALSEVVDYLSTSKAYRMALIESIDGEHRMRVYSYDAVNQKKGFRVGRVDQMIDFFMERRNEHPEEYLINLDPERVHKELDGEVYVRIDNRSKFDVFVSKEDIRKPEIVVLGLKESGDYVRWVIFSIFDVEYE